MILPSVLSTALLACTAQAFLVPTEIADKVEFSKAPNGAPSIFNHNSQSIEVDCSNCPFALRSERHGHHEWIKGIKNNLVLQISAQNDELLLNGQHIYPVNPRALPSPVYVKQKKHAEDESKVTPFEGELKLSYSLSFGPEKPWVEPGLKDLSLVEITLTLLGLDNEMIVVDDLDLKVIKTGGSKLHIATIGKLAPQPSDPSAKCTNMLCRAMTKFLTKVASVQQSTSHAAAKAAHKVKCFCVRCMHHMAHGMGHQMHGHEEGVRLPTHHKVRPEDLIRKVPTATHSIIHKIVHGFKAFAKVFLLPTFIGATVGFTASALGMAVGQFIVLVWTKLRRGGDHAYERIEVDEKEDLPPYEETSVIRVLDEKEDIERA